jgi:2-oxoglutarate ferredoxin oxidoreductase subunit alpha
MTGNDAIGAAAVHAGCFGYFGYPITPQNELTTYMARHMPAHHRVFIQAESEIAAISMVYGMASTGKRTMTSSSSPGISLKQEGISTLAGAELPSVIVNIQRGGPGLGNIAPAQSDYFQATKGGGHGDYHQIVLAPDSVQEMYDLTVLSFTLADRYRTPVMLLSDGRLGQMMEPIVLSGTPAPKSPRKPWALTGCRGRKPNMVRSLMLNNGDLEKHNMRLQAKYALIRETEVRYEERMLSDCDVLLVAYGTSARLAKGVLETARAAGLRLGLLRPITLWPFPSEIIGRIARRCKAVLVVEMSAGQMVEDVRLAVNGICPVHFEGRMGGGVPSESDVWARVQAILGPKPSRKGRK